MNKVTKVFEGQVCGPEGTEVYRVVKRSKWGEENPPDQIVLERQMANDALGQPAWREVDDPIKKPQILAYIAMLMAPSAVPSPSAA